MKTTAAKSIHSFEAWLVTAFLAASLPGCTASLQTTAGRTATPTAIPCQVTRPNASTPPGEKAAPDFYGNGALWTTLWPDGTVVFEPGGPGEVGADGSLSMKFPWWHAAPGRMTITGRRLDAPAPPLEASIPDGYQDTKFQSTGLTFPTEGCWEVTGRLGQDSLSFVTRVEKRDLP